MPPSFRIREWARKAQEQTYDQVSKSDAGVIEEQGERDKRRWENHARGLVRRYSTRKKPPVPKFSTTPSEDVQPQTGKYETDCVSGAPPKRIGNVDVEACQPSGPLIEPLPLGRQNGVLGTLLTLYGNPEFSRTTTSLGSTTTGGDDTGTDTDTLGDGDDGDRSVGRNAREDVTNDASGQAMQKPLHGRHQVPQPAVVQVEKELVGTHRQTGLQSIVETQDLTEPDHDCPQTQQPSVSQVKKGSAGVRFQTDLQPNVNRDAEDPARHRRRTGLPPVNTLEHPSPRDESLPPSEEDEIPSRVRMSPYGHTRQSRSAPSSALHLPLPRIPSSIAQISSAATFTSKPSSSGGVVAALLATSNNLAGAATPAANTIGPNLSRHGYTLSRYESSAPQKPTFTQTASQDPHREPSEEHLQESPSPEEIPSRQETNGTNTTNTTNTTLSSPTQKVERDFAEHTERSSLQKAKHSSFTNWFPYVRSRPGSRAPSIAGDKEKVESTRSSQEDLIAHQIAKRLHKRAKKERRRQEQIYITKHIAEVLQRQEFIMKFARAHIMFAGPGHRLQSQLQVTARVLDLQISTVYLPNVLLISFGDESTSTSNVKIIQQSSSLNLEKLSVMHELLWKVKISPAWQLSLDPQLTQVIHDELSVASASAALDLLMQSPHRYNRRQRILFGGLASSAICTVSFSGSFADALIVYPMGCLLVITQTLSSKNKLYSNVFEITIATILSFLSAALASSGKFCYASLASSSVVLILPGFFVLSGSLELASKQIVSGAVRICFAVIYSLFLGFGIAIGAQVFTRITNLQVVGPDDFLCDAAHPLGAPWWDRKPSLWFAFLTVPLYSLALSLLNQAPFWRKDMLATLLISCGGWTANHFAGVAFQGRPDIQSAIGAFAVGVAANLYARFFYENAYVVMITGILFQLPSGLANGGLLTFAAADTTGSTNFSSYEAGFQVAIQLIAVAIGLTVGLFTSVVVVHPFGGSKRRQGSLFSL